MHLFSCEQFLQVLLVSEMVCYMAREKLNSVHFFTHLWLDTVAKSLYGLLFEKYWIHSASNHWHKWQLFMGEVSKLSK